MFIVILLLSHAILGQVWYLIVSIPDPWCLSYFVMYADGNETRTAEQVESNSRTGLVLQAMDWELTLIQKYNVIKNYQSL